MASAVDEDWLKFPNESNPSETANNFDNELPLPQGDQEIDYSYDNNNDNTATKKGGGIRKLCIGLVILVVVIGAAIGISFGVLSSRNKKQEGSINGSNPSISTSAASGVDSNTDTDAGTTASVNEESNNEIAVIINGIARYNGSEFTDPDSYQSLAKKWVLQQNFPIQDGSRMTTEQQARQLYVVACIFYSTFAVRSQWTDLQYGTDVDIPGWFSYRGWLDSSEDVCSNWHGLTCNESGRITKIELDTNGLTGSFPQETALLYETLITIDLYNNIVHNAGELGNSWMGELTNLEYLYLGTTSFEYEGFPPDLGKLTKLKELDFSYSLYFGDISQAGPAFGNLSNLKYLVMDGNAYNSSLPSELVQLPELEYLYAGYSFLEGGLDFVSSMTNIYELWLDDNPGLKGTIPAGISSLGKLASFSASNCGLTGSIPSEMGLMTDMIQLWLNDNDLVGDIPSDFGNLVTLKIMKLENNQLVGEMPSNICARRRPFGRLEELGADCDNTITCTNECCTCCGVECTV
mmetsp:Transcript_15311/g.16886  ORF Transcript_15311/g.16886 Transcript_15311/m.16886 type:complete len:520 (-) Transcript_15311:720-2279(-)